MPWLSRQLNGNGLSAPTWKGGTKTEWNSRATGTFSIKSELLANIKKQLGLPQSHSFVAENKPKA